MIDRTTIPRRDFLRRTSLVLSTGLLASVLKQRQAARAAETPSTSTAVIFVTLGGGPSQFETYDPKPLAPAEYRGDFQAIATRVPGVSFCELLPRQAALADHLAVIRSIQHTQASHIAEHIVETGYDLRNSANSRQGEMPSQGAVVSKLRGMNPSGLPSYVSLPQHHGYSGPHWLGSQHHFFAVNDDPNKPDFRVGNLALHEKLTLDRLQDRRTLVQELDRVERIHDLTGAADALDSLGRQAINLVTGERARLAFDLDRESPVVREQYGRNPLGQRLLLARRLVEAGVPFVTVRMGDWDDHSQLRDRISVRAPQFDQGVATLIEDLRQRGLTQDVLVVAMGEFGRTPRVNSMGGRDHWPAVNSVMLSGGRFRMGQDIGATDGHGARVLSAPYAPQSVLAMIYRHLGIDPALTFNDYAGRPRYILEEREPVVELL